MVTSNNRLPSRLEKDSGVFVSLPSEKAACFRDRCLHEDNSCPYVCEIDNWLALFHSPKLSQQDVVQLNTIISPQEVSRVILELPWKSAPGADGVGYAFYKLFIKHLCTPLSTTFNGILFDGKAIPEEWLLSIIKPIPKSSGS